MFLLKKNLPLCRKHSETHFGVFFISDQINTISMDKFYSTPTNEEFYKDCIRQAVYIQFDRMHDASWYRITSDQPLEWFLLNTAKVTSSQLIVRSHQLRNEDERWNADTHLEINVELREKSTTYLLTIEMDQAKLDHFLSHYELK